MTRLIELYQQITEKMTAIGASYTKNVDTQILYSEFTKEDRDKVLFFQEELKKLEDCLGRIQYFREIAEKHIISLNTLPIVPREVDMTRIKTWADRIDFFSDDDPYAARLYVLCRSNELYLNKKITVTKDILSALGCPPASRNQEVLQNHEQDIIDECRKLIESSEYKAFIDLLYPERKEQIFEKAETDLSEETDNVSSEEEHMSEGKEDGEESIDKSVTDLFQTAGDIETEAQKEEPEIDSDTAEPEKTSEADSISIPVEPDEKQQETENSAEDALQPSDDSEEMTE